MSVCIKENEILINKHNKRIKRIKKQLLVYSLPKYLEEVPFISKNSHKSIFQCENQIQDIWTLFYIVLQQNIFRASYDTISKPLIFFFLLLGKLLQVGSHSFELNKNVPGHLWLVFSHWGHCQTSELSRGWVQVCQLHSTAHERSFQDRHHTHFLGSHSWRGSADTETEVVVLRYALNTC